MHAVGTKIEGALHEFFPGLDMRVQEMDMRHMLTVAWVVGEKRYAAHTPAGVDYRQRDYQHWLHKFTEIIRGKTS